MSDGTKIEWTEATANVINGCSVLSPGCTNCYAMRLAGTRMKHHQTREGLTIDTKAGPVWNGTTRFHEPALQQVLHWQRGRMIFWNAHGDMFHDSVPDEWIDRCFAAMALTPQHKHQVLTKRSARMRDYLSRPGIEVRIGLDALGLVLEAMSLNPKSQLGAGIKAKGSDINPGGLTNWPLPNVWLGVSVEDQTRADERIPDLLATPAAVRWISAEPLLGPLYLRGIKTFQFRGCELVDSLAGWGMDFLGEEVATVNKIDWVVAGGESGPNARPMHPDWARSLRDQCAAAGVAFLFKQWGEWYPGLCGRDGDQGGIATFPGFPDGETFGGRPTHWWGNTHSFSTPPGPISVNIGKKRAGRLLDGVQHDGYPA